MNRREFVAASVTGAVTMQQGRVATATPAGDLQLTVDATKISEPVTPLIFGGYMEPATTRVWAEMLADRKFARPITDTAPPASSPFRRRFHMRLWRPVGSAGHVEMDKVNP
ncbi:MAG: hypothetical protein ACRD22_12810, partial [Terriglobia bacterium]